MERNIVLKVKGNSYGIKFPNVGEFQRIETLKQLISEGMYQQLMTTPTVSTLESLKMVDMEAYFTVLAPKLVKDYECDSFKDLDIQDYLELKVEFEKQFVPWWNKILDILSPNNKKGDE